MADTLREEIEGLRNRIKRARVYPEPDGVSKIWLSHPDAIVETLDGVLALPAIAERGASSEPAPMGMASTGWPSYAERGEPDGWVSLETADELRARRGGSGVLVWPAQSKIACVPIHIGEAPQGATTPEPLSFVWPALNDRGEPVEDMCIVRLERLNRINEFLESQAQGATGTAQTATPAATAGTQVGEAEYRRLALALENAAWEVGAGREAAWEVLPPARHALDAFVLPLLAEQGATSPPEPMSFVWPALNDRGGINEFLESQAQGATGTAQTIAATLEEQTISGDGSAVVFFDFPIPEGYAPYSGLYRIEWREGLLHATPAEGRFAPEPSPRGVPDVQCPNCGAWCRLDEHFCGSRREGGDTLTPETPLETAQIMKEARELIAFLDGSAPLFNVWFGERMAGNKGLYWWRNAMRIRIEALLALVGEEAP